MHWPPVSDLTCRSFLAVVRELLETKASATLFTAVQKWAYDNDQGDFGAFVRQMKKVDPKFYPRLVEALSNGQIDSKLWLIETLKAVLPERRYHVSLLGGWFGILGLMMLWLMPERVRRVWSYDIDPDCETVINVLARWRYDDWAIRPITFDMYEVPLAPPYAPDDERNWIFAISENGPDVIVNTSCEHLGRFPEWYARVPEGRVVALQSNNFFACPEHVNCVASIEDFKQMAPMSTVLYEGRLSLQDYDRFMLVGIR